MPIHLELKGWGNQMDANPDIVHVVVDPVYGERIRDLPVGECAWIRHTIMNQAVVDALLQEYLKTKDGREGNNTENISVFDLDPSLSPEQCLLTIIPTIERHHYETAQGPGYSILNVIGVSWSECIRREFQANGFVFHKNSSEGFVVKREW